MVVKSAYIALSRECRFISKINFDHTDKVETIKSLHSESSFPSAIRINLRVLFWHLGIILPPNTLLPEDPCLNYFIEGHKMVIF